MLDIYTENGWIPIVGYKGYYTDYDYDGTQILSFDIGTDSDIFRYIKNEGQIKNEENCYLIKKVNKRKSVCTIEAELDMDEWKKDKPYVDTKEDRNFQTKTLSDILEFIKPTGWKIINANIRDIRRTPELKDVSKYDVLFSLQKIFNVVYEIHTLTKEIVVINPENYVDKGLYITPELNLNSIEWKGASNKFCTRLYAYGKDGLSFASINDGKDYVENNDYTNKVISATWRDDRYTVQENLLEDAKKKIKEIAVPIISYTVSVNDLSKTNEEYRFLDFNLYDKVHTIVDEHTTILQTIVKYRKYHETPEENVITLSTEAKKISDKIDKITSILGDDGEKLEGSILEQAQKEAAEIINAFATKGHRYVTENETYYLDKLPKEAAKYVMRQNLGGIAFSHNGYNGPYVTAWTIDGKFNADFITTGTLRAIKIEAVDIVGGTITGTTIKGSTITGGKITGETTINVGTDLIVGDSIYVGQNQTGHFGGRKGINFIEGIGFQFTKVGENGSITMITKGAGGIRNNFDEYQTVVDANIDCVNLVASYQNQIKNQFSVYQSSTNSSYQISVSSDKRLKENINDIDLIPLFDEVSVKRFDYKSGKKDSVGVIAQDYVDNPLSNYILSKDEKGFYSVDYSVLYMASVQKIKQLEERIKKLEKLMGVTNK